MSITVKNYLEERAKIDFSKLPEKYKKVDEFITEALDFYGEDAEIDKTIDEGIKQLNAEAGGDYEQPKPFKPTKEETEAAMKSVSKHLGKGMVLKSKDHPDLEVRGERPKSSPAVKKVVKEHVENSVKKHEEADHKAATEKKERETKAEAAERKRKYNEEIQEQFNKIAQGGDISLTEVVRIGKHVESLRSTYSQVMDEGSDNKNRLTPTKENLVRWMKAPGKFDLIGVDTASKTDATADLKHVKKETILHLLGFKNKGENK